jgi:hypothetical protein
LDAHPEAGLVSCRVAGFPAGHVRRFAIYLDWQTGYSAIRISAARSSSKARCRTQRDLPPGSAASGGYQDHGCRVIMTFPASLPGRGALCQAAARWNGAVPARLTHRPRTLRPSAPEGLYLARLLTTAWWVWGAGWWGRRLARQGVPVRPISISTQKIAARATAGQSRRWRAAGMVGRSKTRLCWLQEALARQLIRQPGCLAARRRLVGGLRFRIFDFRSKAILGGRLWTYGKDRGRDESRAGVRGR